MAVASTWRPGPGRRPPATRPTPRPGAGVAGRRPGIPRQPPWLGFGLLPHRSQGVTWRSGRVTPIRWAPPSTGRGRTSRCSARQPSPSNCACSAPAAGRPGSSCRRTTATSGTATCRPCSQGSVTGIGCTGRTTRPLVSAATRTSCCSIRTPRRSPATSGGTTRCSPTRSATPTRRIAPTRWTPQTPRATCRKAWSSTRTSTGRATSTRGSDTTTRSSTRPTSRA